MCGVCDMVNNINQHKVQCVCVCYLSAQLRSARVMTRDAACSSSGVCRMRHIIVVRNAARALRCWPLRCLFGRDVMAVQSVRELWCVARNRRSSGSRR